MKSAPIDRVLVVKAAAPGPELPIVEHGGSARAVIWPGIGASQRSMHLIELEPGGATVALLHDSECVYHVSEGGGTMEDVDDEHRHDVITGSMLFIEPGTRYRFVAGDDGVLLVGGPCPPDPALYAALDAADPASAEEEQGD